MNPFFKSIHDRAVANVKEFKKKESEVIEDLIEIDKYKIFRFFGYTSLFQYCVSELKLTESQSYQFIGIARKSVEIPEIKQAIDTGKISVSNARRIVSVLTPENKDLWIEKAATLPQRKLEMEIVKENPKEIKKEIIKPIAEDKYEFRTYLNKSAEENLKRVKDLLSQKFKKAISAEEAIEFLMQDYLQRQDPVKKAERAMEKNNAKLNIGVEVKSSNLAFNQTSNSNQAQLCLGTVMPVRKPIPSYIRHQINLRDKNQCTHTHNGQRCSNQRWLHLHHLKPVANGGQNSFQNLTTLCSGHHRLLHN